MSNPFGEGRVAPTVVPPMKPFKSQDGSYQGGSIAALNMQPHSDPLPVETPTRAAPVSLTTPLTTPSNPAGSAPAGKPRASGVNVGPMANTKPLADPNYSPDMRVTQGPGTGTAGSTPLVPAGITVADAQDAGTARGRAIVADAEHSKSAEPFGRSPLFRVLSKDGRA